jgi:hypothetical protein
MPRPRRLRGLLLRLVLNRPAALVTGALIAAPGMMLLVRDYAWESGVTDGLALVSVATGFAIAWAGASGRKPDWIE